MIKQACNLLKNTNNADDPLEHGWVEQFGMLLPGKHLKALPENVLKTCLCQKSCDSKNCICKVLFTAMVKVSVNNARTQKLGDVSQK